jgi:hypothetical protein
MALELPGCKKRATVAVPQNILHAKTASLQELLHVINLTNDIQTLQAGIKAEYVSEEQEYDQIELEKYPKAPGLILLKRPSTIYLVVQNPVLKKREISFLSKGNEFRVWIHGKRRFYIGNNNSKELISEDMTEKLKIPIRAAHLYQALLPDAVEKDNPEIRVSKIEDRDENTKYYILTVYREDDSLVIHPMREIRIERAGLTISRQRTFDDEGAVQADIIYSDVKPYGKYFLPGKIHLERPLDGYSLDLEFNDWQINPEFKEDIFTLEPPEGVEVIRFK